MEFTLNIVYGGELNASKALSPFVRNMRKIIKDTFTSFENEAVTMFKVTLFFDGDISSYYNGTGIYQPRYYNVKKEYVVSFCIDRTQWTGNKEKDLNYFIFTITSLMIKNGDADGELAGAQNTTGNVLRPAFQIVKTKPGISVVSGALLMFTPTTQYGENGLLVFAD